MRKLRLANEEYEGYKQLWGTEGHAQDAMKLGRPDNQMRWSMMSPDSCRDVLGT